MDLDPNHTMDCPRCGNVNNLADWTVGEKLVCTVCGCVLKEPRELPAGWQSMRDIPAPKKKADIRQKIRTHIDIHHLAEPEEMQLPERDEPATERERVPFIPLSECMPGSLEWDTPPEAAAKPGTAWMPSLRGGSGTLLALLPAWAFATLMWGARLALLGLIGWLLYSTATSSRRLRELDAGRPATSPARGTTAFTHDACMAVAKAFLAANTPAEKSALVRDPDRVRPFMDAFAPKVGTGSVIDLRAYGFAQTDAARVRSFLVKFSDGGSRVVCVADTPDGPKVDWEAFARHGTATATELKNGKATTAEVRALATSGTYYNYQFHDDQLWKAVELTNSDWADSLTGYARADSDTASQLTKLMDAAAGVPVPVLLRLSTDPESAPRGQCVIEELIVPHWVKP